MTRRKEILYSFILIGLSLLSLELLARGWHALRPAADGLNRDKLLHHKWAPNTSFTGSYRIDGKDPVRYTANRQSWLEDYDITETKPSGTFRIFYIGDSNTSGVVQKEFRMPTLVKQHLLSANVLGDRKLEVINTGTSSYSFVLYYLMVKNQILNYSPDLVVINGNMNDLAGDRLYLGHGIYNSNGELVAVSSFEKEGKHLQSTFGEIKETQAQKIIDSLEKYSVFLNLAKNKLSVFSARFFPLPDYKELRAQVKDDYSDWLKENWSESVKWNAQQSMNYLGKTIDMLRQKNIPVVVTASPDYPQYTGEWSTKPHALIEKTSLDHGALYLNSFLALKPSLEKSVPGEYYFKTDVTHFTEKGNELWARVQADFLLSNWDKILNVANNQQSR